MSTTKERQYWRDNPDTTNDLDIFCFFDEIDHLARENERLRGVLETIHKQPKCGCGGYGYHDENCLHKLIRAALANAPTPDGNDTCTNPTHRIRHGNGHNYLGKPK